MNKRPNILFLMSDEHRADMAGFAGHRVVRTPVLDELASSGVVFTNAYTPSPVCIPARQCLMSGQLPKTCGCEGWIDLRPGYMTFARQFAAYAYETVVFGKLHHIGTDQMQGWTQRPAGDVHVTPPHLAGKVDEEVERHVRKLGDCKWDNAKEIRRAGIGRSPYGIRDELALQSGLAFIEEYFNSPFYDREHTRQPILLKFSFNRPHYPFLTDADRFNYYLNRVEPFLNDNAPDHPVLSKMRVRVGVDVSEREMRRATAAYCGMIEENDIAYGAVLQALRQVGQDLDDWIILYTTDHGDMLGEHGVWEKQSFYEGSVRVPLIIRWPKGFTGGRTLTENVSLCDLFTTLTDLAGIPTPPGLDSRSLSPLLREESCNWDNEVISAIRTNRIMIKRDHLKFLNYGDEGPDVLFDLEKDPRENVNVIDRPEYRDAVERFRKRLGEV